MEFDRGQRYKSKYRNTTRQSFGYWLVLLNFSNYFHTNTPIFRLVNLDQPVNQRFPR